MYDVRPSGAGCGLGCFAARDIVKGETIMEEAPLLRWSMARTAEGAEGQAVPTAAPRSSTMASLGRRADAGELPSSLQSTLRGLEGALAALDPDSRAAFFALSHQNKEETATAAAIWMSNAFALGSADDGSIETDAHDAIETGVFASISRLQHCCRPNADHTWDAALGRKSVVASRDIPSGEEIFLSYLGGSSILRVPRSRRRASLRRTFGFDCACERCGRGDEDDDARWRRGASSAAEVSQSVSQ